MNALDRQVGGTHYKDRAIQPIQVMQMVLTPEEYRGYLKGNILKYSMRAGTKGDAAEDVAKAHHYKQFLKEFECQVTAKQS